MSESGLTTGTPVVGGAADHARRAMASRFRTTLPASGEPCSKLALMRLRVEPRREAAASISALATSINPYLAERSEMVPS
jgi:hypothetical protein